jgi:hypothetical protein
MTSPGRICIALAAALALASCGRKEQPPAQVATPPPATLATATPPPPPTTAPTPPPVWRAAHWGMGKEEVLAAFPAEAQRLEQPASFSQPQPGSSLTPGSSEIAIPAFEQHGARFRVLFGFGAGDALDRIQLAAVKAGPHTCEDLEAALTKEHSAPAQSGSIGTSLRGEEIVWRTPAQTITLDCMGVARLGFQTVTLDYAVPSRSVAGN